VVCTILLLLSGDIEANPGPATDCFSIGCLNICSAANKTGCIHDIISDFRLDILAVCETRIRQDDPPAMKNSIAPEGYLAQHVHRDSTAAGRVAGSCRPVAVCASLTALRSLSARYS
jgi:hypothetical protein